jgi:MFS family permease
MFKRQSYDLTGLTNRSTFAAMTLVANALVWYYIILTFLYTNVNDILIWTIHFSGLIFSALFGATLVRRFERSKLLVFWILIGTISSLTIFGLGHSTNPIVGSIALMLGISFGLGMPACMGYYTDCMPIEKRGRISGITMLLSGIGIVAFAVLSINDYFILAIVLGLWRLLSFAVILFAKPFQTVKPIRDFSSYKLILTQQSFTLYFVPWIMFSLANYLASPFTLELSSNGIVSNSMIIQTAFMGIFAFFGGFFLDSVGRKRVAIAGFSMLGLGTAVLGLSSSALASYFSAVVDGTAWGFLLVLFVLTIWGDISYSSSSEKYYALGVLPFFVSCFLNIIIGPYITKGITSSSTLFSLTAFFLFLAILPLVYAPETLPEKTIKNRDFRMYIEKAQEIKQKHS